MAEDLLVMEDVRKHYPLRTGLTVRRSPVVRAVDGVSLRLRAGQCLSLVGESGSGKSTTAKLVLGLEEPTEGSVRVAGRRPGARGSRGVVQAVFQDPYSSLNPRMRVRRIIEEPLLHRGGMPKSERVEWVEHLMGLVGLPPEDLRRFPHEFSGGQRQRIAIARALAPRPQLLVLDEPVSALDVSIRAQIINVLLRIQRELGTAYLVISHDLSSVQVLSDVVAVMYMGQVVEVAPAAELFTTPRHPYTQALLSAALPARPGSAAGRIRLAGEIPSPVHPPSGCRFRTRCPVAMPECATPPPLRRYGDASSLCHLEEPSLLVSERPPTEKEAS